MNSPYHVAGPCAFLFHQSTTERVFCIFLDQQTGGVAGVGAAAAATAVGEVVVVEPTGPGPAPAEVVGLAVAAPAVAAPAVAAAAGAAAAAAVAVAQKKVPHIEPRVGNAYQADIPAMMPSQEERHAEAEAEVLGGGEIEGEMVSQLVSFYCGPVLCILFVFCVFLFVCGGSRILNIYGRGEHHVCRV